MIWGYVCKDITGRLENESSFRGRKKRCAEPRAALREEREANGYFSMSLKQLPVT